MYLEPPFIAPSVNFSHPYYFRNYILIVWIVKDYGGFFNGLISNDHPIVIRLFPSQVISPVEQEYESQLAIVGENP